MSALEKKITSNFTAEDGRRWSLTIVAPEPDVEVEGPVRPLAAASDVSAGGLGPVVAANRPHTIDLEIEWPSTEKHEPLQGSTATVTLLSATDRQFLDLYTVDPTAVKLTIERGGEVYWRGVMDPEQYEEPFERANNYEVQLTFSDLGPLDRLKYAADGGDTAVRESVLALVRRALAAAGQPDDVKITVNHRLCKSADDGLLSLADIYVSPENFFDEDGEPMTWREVLSGVLTPLGLRLVQTEGAWRLYDLAGANSVYAPAIDWQGASSTLGIDKVYNRFEVNFSPYGNNASSEVEVTADDLADPVTSREYKANYLYEQQSFHTSVAQETAFRLRTSAALTSHPELSLGAAAEEEGYSFYAIEPYMLGQEEGGIIARFPEPGAGSAVRAIPNPYTINHPSRPAENITDPVFTFKVGRYTPPASILDKKNALIRLCLDIRVEHERNLFGYLNPGVTDKRSYDWKDLVNMIYIPVRFYIEGDDGSKYYYQNLRVFRSTAADFRPNFWIGDSLNQAPGWVSGEAPWGAAWLAYYSSPNPESGSPVGAGWVTNRQIIGYSYFSRLGLPAWWDTRGEGEFIAPPPVSGTLYLEVGPGMLPVHMHAEPKTSAENVSSLPEVLVDFKEISRTTTDRGTEIKMGGVFVHNAAETSAVARWFMLRNPRVEIADARGNAAGNSDITYSAALHPGAAEALSVDTVCGSHTAKTPRDARGYYFIDNTPVQTLALNCGGGVKITGAVEELYIASVASQYDTRHVLLTGTASILSMDSVHTDASFAGKKFVITSAVIHPPSGQGEYTFSELSAPKYTPVTIE